MQQLIIKNLFHSCLKIELDKQPAMDDIQTECKNITTVLHTEAMKALPKQKDSSTKSSLVQYVISLEFND